MTVLTYQTLAAAALANTAQEYPIATNHVIETPDDRRTPDQLHPAFHASYDWHSDVHMHWLLVALLRRHSAQIDADAVSERLSYDLTLEKLSGEASYFQTHPQFERPYGWGWLFVLAGEVKQLAYDTSANRRIREDAQSWLVALQPLLSVIRSNTIRWIRNSYAPSRAGTHSNSAFALLLLSCGAQCLGDEELYGIVCDAAQTWFGKDVQAPVAFEPNGYDFLSPTLVEAHLMSRIDNGAAFASWLTRFFPKTVSVEDQWLKAPAVLDFGDAQQGHLIGLALDRAWHCRVLAEAIDDTKVSNCLKLASRKNNEWATGIIEGGLSFQHTHWLATFLFLAVECRSDLLCSK